MPSPVLGKAPLQLQRRQQPQWTPHRQRHQQHQQRQPQVQLQCPRSSLQKVRLHPRQCSQLIQVLQRRSSQRRSLPPNKAHPPQCPHSSPRKVRLALRRRLPRSRQVARPSQLPKSLRQSPLFSHLLSKVRRLHRRSLHRPCQALQRLQRSQHPARHRRQRQVWPLPQPSPSTLLQLLQARPLSQPRPLLSKLRQG